MFKFGTKEDILPKEMTRNNFKRDDEQPPTDSEHLKLWQAIYGVKSDISDLRAEMHKENHNNTKWIVQIISGCTLAIIGLVSYFGITIISHIK